MPLCTRILSASFTLPARIFQTTFKEKHVKPQYFDDFDNCKGFNYYKVKRNYFGNSAKSPLWQMKFRECLFPVWWKAFLWFLLRQRENYCPWFGRDIKTPRISRITAIAIQINSLTSSVVTLSSFFLRL